MLFNVGDKVRIARPKGVYRQAGTVVAQFRHRDLPHYVIDLRGMLEVFDEFQLKSALDVSTK